jgi:hypothetical protein
MEYSFGLDFKLARDDEDWDEMMGRLAAAGCEDSTVCVGVPGVVALLFDREADSAEQAIISAIAAAKQALPGAELTEASPDLAGLTDIAELIGMSRQNMRKLALNHANNFPTAFFSGSTTLWHLAPVLEWLIARGYSIDQKLLDVARLTMQINLLKELQHLEQPVEPRISALLAYPKHEPASKDADYNAA